MQWRVTSRFLRDHRAASVPLQLLAEREVHLMQRRARASSAWVSEYSRLRGVPREKILEVDVGGGPRLLAHLGDGQVTLLALGGHDVTTRYSRSANVESELRTANELPPAFRLGRRDPFFPDLDAKAPTRLPLWGPEIAPGWLYFLDEEQTAVTDQIVGSAEEVLISEDQYTVHFVIGGPGTGKTSILLQLLRRLSSQIEAGIETWRVALDISDKLADYVTSATGWNLDETRRLFEAPEEADILLVDDPAFPSNIRRCADAVRMPGSPSVLVVAFDPLQLHESVSDGEYQELIDQHNANEWRLRVAYRQKAKVGRAAVKVANVVAASSPFLDDHKQRNYAAERSRLTHLANDLRFPNPSGHARTYHPASLADWRAHLGWIRRQVGLWGHWPPLLVVVDDESRLPRQWHIEIGELRHDQVVLGDLDTVKGLEYQHVALIISEGRYTAIEEGFTGTGRRLYNDYRLLRIPFSRAKDSLAVFVRE